jgi:type IV fimbrial biogenesis protein FimT
MKLHRRHPRNKGFTLVELLVVLALVAIVLMLAAPSFRDMIELQRLRSASAQFVTDVQFTRTEAVSRQEVTGISFQSNSAMSCYIVHTCATVPADTCTCTCMPSSNPSCSGAVREVRTVRLPADGGVSLAPERVGTSAFISSKITFDPATGGMTSWVASGIFGLSPDTNTEFWAKATLISAGTAPSLRTKIGALGRTQVCAPGGRVSGVDPC